MGDGDPVANCRPLARVFCVVSFEDTVGTVTSVDVGETCEFKARGSKVVPYSIKVQL